MVIVVCIVQSNCVFTKTQGEGSLMKVSPKAFSVSHFLPFHKFLTKKATKLYFKERKNGGFLADPCSTVSDLTFLLFCNDLQKCSDCFGEV